MVIKPIIVIIKWNNQGCQYFFRMIGYTKILQKSNSISTES